MLYSIKKNWWIVLAAAVLLLAIKFLWPSDPEEQVLPAPPKPEKKAEIQKPKPVPPVEKIKHVQPPAADIPELEDVREENIEDISYVEEFEEDVPEKRNHVLCEYIVSGESRYQFTGEIRLINKGFKPIYGWSVQWEFEDGSTIIEATDVALAGSNPYTGEYLESNAEIAPGETVKFSFTAVKGGDTGPKGVKVEGEFCM